MTEQESVYLWSNTALTNGSADTAVNFSEGQLPGTLNNSNRAVMAAVAHYIKDTNGSLTTAGSANAYTLTINGRMTPLATGHRLSFKANFTNTGVATLAVTNADAVALGAKAIRGPGDVGLTIGKIVSGGVYDVRYDTAANSSAGAWILLNPSGNAVVARGHIAGLTLSTAGSSGTFGIAVGMAADDTASDLMALASAYTKTTSAWAVGTGNGGLDTGAIANSTFYRVFLIKRPDTGVVDVLFSTSFAPTMPTNYLIKRYIGSMFTDGSAHWWAFRQVGDNFYWVVPFADVNDTALSTTDNQYVVTVPSGLAVIAMVRGYVTAAALKFVLVHSGADGAMAANTPTGNFNVGMEAINNFPGYELQVPTDTTQHVRAVSTGASTTLTIVTYGWIDARGKND